jgi:Thioredoxin like C-terminal domain
LHGVAYGGRWTVEGERIVAGEDARLRLAFHAGDVFLVLGTAGEWETVEVELDGSSVGTVQVTQDDVYTLARNPGEKRDHVLDLRLSPGTEAYAFTFG